MSDAWKIPLKRALITTPVPTRRPGRCDPLCIRRFIYAALANAGMENRSPFGALAILGIWRRSGGRTAAVRSLCLSGLDSLTRPALNFSHSYALMIVASTALLLWSVISPQVANTNLAQSEAQSILEFVIHPLPDIDAVEASLPSTSDYAEAPYSPGIRAAHGLADRDWILRQDENAYMLQLLSATELSGLKHFCQRHSICDQSAYYLSQVNGKPLYRLLFGSYPNNRTAQVALQQLAPELQELKPWSRQLRQVQQEING